ncbi:MAG: DUF294 nucleotidyltransferase-like domain-containing protein [Hyphomicrobiales bacterium]
MAIDLDVFLEFASRCHPLDLVPSDVRASLAEEIDQVDAVSGDTIYEVGTTLPGFYLILSGAVEIVTASGDILSRLSDGDAFGERGLLRDGLAPNSAVAAQDSSLYMLPKADFNRLLHAYPGFRAYFSPQRLSALPLVDDKTLFSTRLADLMSADPVSVSPETSVRDAARLFSERRISCLPVVGGAGVVGIVTTRDVAERIVARGRDNETPVGEIMTPDPVTLPSDALGYNALLTLVERGIGHLPVTENSRLKGVLTLTDLVRHQSLADIFLVIEIKKKRSVNELAGVISKIPQLLAQLNSAGLDANKIGQIITSVTDALTARLIDLAEIELGTAPVPYLWLACGSQGRREQTGISDQDNCLILSNDFDTDQHAGYFTKLAEFVCDGLDACGYYYCPGEMMATNDRWRQPLSRWREYFRGWIAQPDPMAQMLASVMFDLRPIVGERTLFEGLVEETLSLASANSIFQAHMISNSLKHSPALGLFGGFALIRKGEHKDTVDLKLGGVVPIVDLARVYALRGAISEVNTLDRLDLAIDEKTVSESGGRDLIDAYRLVADVRLNHQARLIREGAKPDNFMSPNALSELERNHLRDAFVVIKTMQSALAHSQSALS